MRICTNWPKIKDGGNLSLFKVWGLRHNPDMANDLCLLVDMDAKQQKLKDC